jgi:hypothetical protein
MVWGGICLGTVTFKKKKTSFLHDLIIVPSYARRFPPKIIITRIERGVFLSLVFGLWSFVREVRSGGTVKGAG